MIKKVALFLPSLEAGGAERVAINLCNGLIDKGIKVDLILICPGEQLLSILPPQVQVIRLQRRRVVLAIPQLVGYLRRNNPNAVISILTHVNIISLVTTILAFYKGRLILTEHSSVSQNLIKQPGCKNKIMIMLMKLFYPYADMVIAVSAQLMHELEKIANLKNVTCIYNPVDISLPADEDINFLEKSVSSRPNTQYLVATVGRLTKAKNFALLIKSIEIVRKEIPVILNIIGEGEERENLERLINERNLSNHVFLHGYSDYPKMWMRSSDLFVLSSSWEGLPLVVVEALAMGVTVVATDCHTGPAEILENGRYGYLVPVNDPEKMAEAIIFALKNPMDPDMLKKRAEEFSIPNITKQYLKVIFPDG